jgi:soluble lytic murein transglycosylase-like protein
MSATLSSKRWFARAAAFVFDFMHGSLMMSGVITSLAIAALLAGNPGAAEAAKTVLTRLSEVPSAAYYATAEALAPETPKAAPALASDLRAALDAVSRRYRVSASALEPVFLAAQTAARNAKLDPLLVIAVIGVESGFNPLSESVMGAQGLMQVMPRYHQDKIPDDAGPLALHDPLINVQVGVQILQESIRRAGGVVAGLQQFGGAADDPDQIYANRVMSEKQKLEAAARRGGRSNNA